MARKTLALTGLFVIIVILQTSCTPISQTNPATTTVTAAPSVAPTNLPLPTFSLVVTATATATPQDNEVVQDCLNVLSSPPAGFTGTGIIPLADFQTGNTVFLNLEDGGETNIPIINELMWGYAISPDRKTLAYQTHVNSSSYSLVLTDAFNQSKQVIYNRQSYFALYYWVNNDELMLGKNSQWAIYNPYTRDEKGYSLDNFPEYDTYNPCNIWVGFDPQAKLAIYKNTNGNTSLLNIESKQTVAEVLDAVQRAPIADWTLDGYQAAIVGATQVGQYRTQAGDNIFSVTRDGRVTQFTYLAEYYGAGLNIHSLSWSPDSNYIAFWMRIPGSSEWRLAVLNTMAKKVTDYCILTDPYAKSGHVFLGVPAPIWSPDSKQIIVEHRTNDSGYVAFVDIAQNIAFQIAQDKIPLGWMLSSK